MVGIARRSVLRGAAAAALVPFAVSVTTAASAAPVAVGVVARRDFEAAIGSKVKIKCEGGTVTATLNHVRDLRHAPGHPDAFTAGFRLDGDNTDILEGDLVDIEFAGRRLSGVGLLLAGEPGRRTAVLLIDRRPVSEHLTTRRA